MGKQPMETELNIAGRPVGPGNPVFIIAELSANHGGSYEQAAATVVEAAKCGADAIKLQTYTPDTITLASDKPYFRITQGTLWDGQILHDLYQTAYTPWEWQPRLKALAEEHGLICFSSPFDLTAVDFLETMDVPAYKIASFEINDLPLIRYAASKGKPMIMSTGIAQWEEIGEAIAACHAVGNHQVALLKCTSAYPAPMDEVNLRLIPKLREGFGVQVGLSDHTMGVTVPLGAVAMGATIIEKHFILDRSLGGPDASFSMEPAEFAAMVQQVRDMELALGTDVYQLDGKSLKNRKFARSLFAVEDIKAGETFTVDNVRSIRPSDGLPPKYLPDLLGRVATQDIERGEPMRWEMIADANTIAKG